MVQVQQMFEHRADIIRPLPNRRHHFFHIHYRLLRIRLRAADVTPEHTPFRFNLDHMLHTATSARSRKSQRVIFSRVRNRLRPLTRAGANW